MLRKVVVPSTMLQAALPEILTSVPGSYIKKTMAVFESAADVCMSKLKDVPGLTPIKPSGAMYIMVGDVCVCV